MYEKLFEPIQIGNMIVKNRLQLSPMGTHYVGVDGVCNERLAQYLIARARGGWGIIVTEMCRVSEDTNMTIIGMYNEAQVKAFKAVTKEIHRYGAKILVQLVHMGRRDTSVLRNGQLPLAATIIPVKPNGDLQHEMTTEEVWAMIKTYITAAENAKKAGFDGVELHCGHGWLLSSFLSPISNKRLDEFGGSIANRCKIVLEIIRGIKERCGKDFVVTVKHTTREYVDGGIDIEESKVMAWLMEKAGADAFHCTQGIMLSNYETNPPSCTPRAYYLENAKAIKSVVKVPVIALGRINDPDLAECILETTDLDMISMARASLADPDFPNKVKVGRTDDIIRCVGCLQMCLGAKPGAGIGCMLNPMTGREWKYLNKKAKIKRRVYVAGGGVSGCAAAIAAAQQGHQVVLYEQSKQLGGQWLAARIPVGKEEFGAFVKWQTRRLEQLGVKIKYNTPLTRYIVDCEKPDIVIIATGGTPLIPSIKGVNEENIVLANDILLGKKVAGEKVIIIGGGLVGAEVADQVAFYGSQVTIIEMKEQIAKEAQSNVRYRLLERLQKRNVTLLTNTKLIEVKDRAVILKKENGDELTITDIDTIIMAVGSSPNKALQEELIGCAAKVVVIGDAERIKLGSENITEAFITGYEI